MNPLVTVLFDCLGRHPVPVTYWAAFSGGCDSRVLLHLAHLACARRGMPLGVVHVDHGLHPESRAWARQCRAVAERLKLSCVVLPADVEKGTGVSLEAAAREARYKAFADWLPAGDVVLSAHHADDQAETLLLQLLRGAGARGLASMPEIAPLGRGWLMRPLLSVTRAELHAEARASDLEWIEDPSNADNRFDRNFLRREVIPTLRARWPSLTKTLGRSARHAADASDLCDQLARGDRIDCSGSCPGSLSLQRVRMLPANRIRNLFRHWLVVQDLPLPGTDRLEEICHQLLSAAPDSCPHIGWPGAEVRRYRDDLYALRPLSSSPQRGSQPWNGQTIHLDSAGGYLLVATARGRGIRIPERIETLEIGFRHGGEQIRPVSRRHRHDLKKLFQQHSVPPWERGRVPLVYIEGRLAAVAGLWVDEQFRARHNEPGLMLRWSRWRNFRVNSENFSS